MRDMLKAYMEHCNLVRAARQAGIDRQTHYNWLKRSPGYREAFEKRKKRGAEYLESVAVERATDGWTEPIYYQGEKCGSVRRFDGSMLQFLLRGMMPEKYGAQRTEISGPQGGPIQTTVKVIFVEPGDTDNHREHGQLP